MEVLWESGRYVPPPRLEPALRNQPQRYPARGASVKRLDHVNLLATDVAACRAFATDVLGYRTTKASGSTTARRPAHGSASRSPPTS